MNGRDVVSRNGVKKVLFTLFLTPTTFGMSHPWDDWQRWPAELEHAWADMVKWLGHFT